jgi:NADH:ubiquinone oxidoreductase subunit K
MQLWLNFWNLIFWFSMLGFLINYSNFLFLFLFSEATWIILYTYSVFLGIYIDDINMFSNTFFILGLAGLEFAVGFLILIVFKKFNISFNIIDNTNLKNFFNKETNKNVTLLNYFWK